MEFEELLEKISEWEKDRENCNTSTMKELLQKCIDAGNITIYNFVALLEIFIQNKERFEKCDKVFEETLNTENLEIYSAASGMDVVGEVNRIQKEMEDSREVKDILDSWKTKSLEEIIEELEKIDEEAQRHIDFTNRQLLKGIQVQRDALKAIFSMDVLLFEQCRLLMNEAFNYHDYDQWEKIKEAVSGEIKDAALELNIFFKITAKLANIVNLFDKKGIRDEFYSATEKNISKIEGQTEALTFVGSYIKELAQYYQNNKYDIFAGQEMS